ERLPGMRVRGCRRATSRRGTWKGRMPVAGRIVGSARGQDAEATAQIKGLPDTADRTRRLYPGRVGGASVRVRRTGDAGPVGGAYRGGMADDRVSPSETMMRAGWGAGIAVGMGVG